MRIFEGPINLDSFHLFPNCFNMAPGSNSIEIHEHDAAHLMILEWGRWELTAIPPDAPPRTEVLEIEEPFDIIEIRAHVKHGIRWLETDRPGRLVCAFSRWTKDGEKLLDPKIRSRHIRSFGVPDVPAVG